MTIVILPGVNRISSGYGWVITDGMPFGTQFAAGPSWISPLCCFARYSAALAAYGGVSSGCVGRAPPPPPPAGSQSPDQSGSVAVDSYVSPCGPFAPCEDCACTPKATAHAATPTKIADRSNRMNSPPKARPQSYRARAAHGKRP